MADVAATLAQWSSTTNSNSPAGTATVGTGVDDNLREIQGVIVRGLSHKGSDIASATTTDIGAVEGLMHDITGTTTITGLGTVRAGILKVLKFEGALTFTHNSTSLILPGGADITTADGDVAIVISEGSGNWRCLAYIRASSEPLAYATQTQMEAASSTVTAVSPGRAQYHPGVAKAWAYATISAGTLTQQVGHNCTLTRDAEGQFTATWGTDFSSANYVWMVNHDGDRATIENGSITQAAGSVQFTLTRTNDLADQDPSKLYIVAFGDQ